MRKQRVERWIIASLLGLTAGSSEAQQAAPANTGSNAGPPPGSFVEGFDEQPPGNLLLQGGWETWSDVHTGLRSPSAQVVNSGAWSAPNCLRMVPQADIVRRVSLVAGRWSIAMQVYVPSAVQDSSLQLTLLNRYTPSAPGAMGEYQWSIQMLLESRVGSYFTGQAVDAINAAPDWSLVPRVPLPRDRWVEVRFEVDLNADRCSQFIDGVPVGPVFRPWSTGAPMRGYGMQGPARRIEAIGLTATGPLGRSGPDILIDELIVQPIATLSCYGNCDSSTEVPILSPADFTCFLARFRALDGYANCDGSTAVPTHTPADFICFLTRFRMGC